MAPKAHATSETPAASEARQNWFVLLGVGALVMAAGAAAALGGSSNGAAAETAASGAAELAGERWQAEGCGALPELEPGAVTLFRAAVSDSELALAHAAQEAARRQPHKLDYERSFGYEAVGVKGHNVTFLHTVFRDVALDLAKRLHCLTLGAQQLRGWGLDGIAGQLQPRTVELITYDAAHGGGTDSNLGWHSDLGSLLTTALALSSPADYQGGAFELRQGADQAVSQVTTKPGDVIVWRGWDPHRVSPVSSGRRQVLVVEWWLGPASKDPALLRGVKASAGSIAHKAKSYEVAVEVDPGNPIAHLNHATHLSEDMRDYQGAELGFEKALKLAPTHAITHLKLGKLMKRKGRTAEALQEMRAAAALEPTSADFALVAAVTAVSQGDAKGLGELEAAAKLAPAQARTYFTVATALASLNRMSEARSQLSKALAIEPSNTDALAMDISLATLDLAPTRDSEPAVVSRVNVVQAEALTVDNVDNLKVAELKSELDRLGLSRSGSRETLRTRLKDALAAGR